MLDKKIRIKIKYKNITYPYFMLDIKPLLGTDNIYYVNKYLNKIHIGWDTLNGNFTTNENTKIRLHGFSLISHDPIFEFIIDKEIYDENLYIDDYFYNISVNLKFIKYNFLYKNIMRKNMINSLLLTNNFPKTIDIRTEIEITLISPLDDNIISNMN